MEVERLLDGEEEVEVDVLGREADRQPRLRTVLDGVVAEDSDRPRGRPGESGRAVDSVDLPAPFGPSSPKNWPASISSDTLRKAMVPVGSA